MKSLTAWRRNPVELGTGVEKELERAGVRSPSKITLVFQARRVGGLQGIGNVPGWRWEHPETAHDAANAIVLKRTRKGARPPRSVDVRSLGDPLQLARIILHLPSGKRMARPDRRAEPDLAPTATQEVSIFGTPEYLTAMTEAFERLPRSRITRYRTFFFQLDRRTEADLVRSSPDEAQSVRSKRVVAALRYVRRAIEARMEAQMRACTERPTVAVPFQDPLSFREYVERISDVFLQLLWEHFSDGTGGIDLEEFEEAFEMFATGELRFWLQKHNLFTTEPSSGAFFLFGQFALLAAECGVEPELWTRMANVMVRAQELYCTTYPPSSERPRLADYRADRHAPHQRPTPRERAELRARYAGFGLEQLSAAALRNLAVHAPGEWDQLGLRILPGVSMPRPAEDGATVRRAGGAGAAGRAKRKRRPRVTVKSLKPVPRRTKGVKQLPRAAKTAGPTRKRRGGRRKGSKGR